MRAAKPPSAENSKETFSWEILTGSSERKPAEGFQGWPEPRWRGAPLGRAFCWSSGYFVQNGLTPTSANDGN